MKSTALQDMVVFLSEVPRSFQEMGAMLPSSGHLGRQLCWGIEQIGRPRTVLEVGPGTGAVTRQIVSKLQSEDTLILCEVNPRFVRLLEEKFKTDPVLNACRAHVVVFEGPIQNLPQVYPELKVDFIVSSLPFSNFAPSDVDQILALYRTLLRSGGTISYYEYLGARFCKRIFSAKPTRVRAKAVSGVVTNWQTKASRDGELRRFTTLLNVPPARSVHMSFPPSVGN